MVIYLPIAEISVNLFLLLGLGGVVGFLSGMFGVGGGFLMTPFLIFLGVPPAVAVGTQCEPDPGLVLVGHDGAHAPRQRRHAHGLGAGGRRPDRRRDRRLAVRAAAPPRPDRSVDLALLRPVPRHGRRADAGRVGARLAAGAPARRHRLHAPPPPPLAARPAAQGPVPPLAALHQRADADRHRRSWPASWSRSWASAAAS